MPDPAPPTPPTPAPPGLPPGTPGPPADLWTAWSSAQLLAWAGACLLGDTAVQSAVYALSGDLFLPVAAGGLLGIVLPTWLVARTHGTGLARDFGFTRPRAGILLWTAVAVAGSMAPTAMLAALSARLRPAPPEWEALFAAHLPRSAPAVGGAFLAVAVAVPLAEELLFRGLLQRLAARHWGDVAGIVVGALLFAILHLEPWYLFGLFGVGLLLGYVWAVTRSLTACAVAHGLHNAAALTMMLRQGVEPGASGVIERGDWLWCAGSLPVLALGCVALARAARRARPTDPARAHL
ncbi:MAG: CPBP family intramembrane glutamic endopeptidase [Candidatus Krumholzibacteriia bacterium]